MPRGDARRIRNYLCQQVEAARFAGASSVTFRAGDVHDELGLTNSYANVCQVLEGWLFHERAGVEIASFLYRPPSGRGASLEIRFRILPSSEEAFEHGGTTSPTPTNEATSTGFGNPSADDADVVRLLGYDFFFAATINPENGPDGAPLEFVPETHRTRADTGQRSRYSNGPFCKFVVPSLPHTSGVFVVTVNDGLSYVGIASDFARRWGPQGYANASSVGESPTNCKVNHYVLLAARVGGRIDLWIHETPNPEPIGWKLIRRLEPPWNGHGPRQPEVPREPEVLVSRRSSSNVHAQAPSAGSPATSPSKGSGCLGALFVTGLARLLRLSR